MAKSIFGKKKKEHHEDEPLDDDAMTSEMIPEKDHKDAWGNEHVEPQEVSDDMPVTFDEANQTKPLETTKTSSNKEHSKFSKFKIQGVK